MEMFYSGELYNQKATYTAIRRGDLDMAWIGFDFYEQQLPYLSMFTSAYFFKNNEHFEKVWTGDIGERVFKDMYEKVGVRPLYVGMVGARNVTLRDIGREVRTPYDMKGVMLRVPDSPSFLLMGKALGANPTPLNYGEVYMALQTGTIDGQENPISHILDAKFYEPSKYLILTEHVQTFSGLAINSKKWDIIGPELQKKMLLASEVAFNRCKQISIENEEKGIKIMKEDGLIIINPDKDSFKEYAEKVYKSNQEFTKDWDWDLYEEVKTLVQ
jgi:TRAP-type transport system periplasmic protein